MFFSMIFYTDKNGRGIWTISPIFRFVMLGIFLLSSTTLLFPAQDEAEKGVISLIIPAFFALTSVSGILYRDCCIFDAQTRILSYTTGLIFLSKRRIIPFHDIGSVRFITVLQGKKPIEFQCALYSKEEHLLADIEHVKKNAQTALEQRAKKAAALIGCPLEYTKL